MFRSKIFLSFLCLAIFVKGYAVSDFTKVKEAKHKVFMSYNCGNRMDVHKTFIAAYFISQGEVVLDLGAHLGNYSLYYRKLVGKNGKVVAYEASPPIFSVLKKRLQHIQNIIVKNRAVSNTSKQKLQMKIYPEEISKQCCTVEQTLWNPERMSGNTKIVEVETEKLDDLLSTNPSLPVSFIKIDVEGHEHAVFEGAVELLKTLRPLVVFEYAHVNGIWETPVIQQIEDLNYVCYDCNTDERVYPGYEIVTTDLLAIPKEREREVVEMLPYLHLNKWEIFLLRFRTLINRYILTEKLDLGGLHAAPPSLMELDDSPFLRLA